MGKANRVAAITMVKNEADIIESFVRHILCLADVLLVADHMSTDATPEILTSLQEEGLALRWERYRQPGYHQAEVMTGLLWKAMREEQADIILALDADEFPVAEQGGTWLRGYLQRLDREQVYQWPWVRYSLSQPESNQGQFLLSRPMLRSLEAELLGKVLLGGGAVQARQLSLSQGNHVAKTPEQMGTVFGVPALPVAQGVHLAHFPKRSQAQQISKTLCMWLSNLSSFTDYTSYTISYREVFKAITEGKPLPEEDLSGMREVQMPAYADECCLRYTGREVQPYANALRQAEQIAADCGLMHALVSRPLVSVLLLWDGRREEFLASLDGIKHQSYKPRQLLVMDMQGRGLDSMVAELEESGIPWGSVMRAEAAKLGQAVKGDYVQWVLPGDVLTEDKLRDMTALLQANGQARLAVSTNLKQDSGWAPGYLGLDRGRLAHYFFGRELLRVMLREGEFCRSNLTGILFRRSLLEECDFLQGAFLDGRLLPAAMWQLCLSANHQTALVQRDFVSEAPRHWTADARILHELGIYYLLDAALAGNIISEAEHVQDVTRFRQRRADLLPVLKAEAEPSLWAAYGEA